MSRAGNPQDDVAGELAWGAAATALNVSYTAQQISIFGIVVGIALLLTGVGLVILALAVFGRRGPPAATAP